MRASMASGAILPRTAPSTTAAGASPQEPWQRAVASTIFQRLSFEGGCGGPKIDCIEKSGCIRTSTSLYMQCQQVAEGGVETGRVGWRSLGDKHHAFRYISTVCGETQR